MALFLIGLGLSTEKDISLRGLELVQRAEVVYREEYTSLLQCSLESLEKLYGKKVLPAPREVVENGLRKILGEAKKKDVALLVVGDPLVATTHIDILLEARKQNIPVEVVHNASVISAVGVTGLQVYKFGKTVSVSFQKDAHTFFDVIVQNQSLGLHTLVLLDLDPSKRCFVTISDALERIAGLEKQKGKVGTTFVGCARLGSRDQKIVAGTAEKLKKIEWGAAPFCLVVPGMLHFMEEEALALFD